MKGVSTSRTGTVCEFEDVYKCKFISKTEVPQTDETHVRRRAARPVKGHP